MKVGPSAGDLSPLSIENGQGVTMVATLPRMDDSFLLFYSSSRMAGQSRASPAGCDNRVFVRLSS